MYAVTFKRVYYVHMFVWRDMCVIHISIYLQTLFTWQAEIIYVDHEEPVYRNVSVEKDILIPKHEKLTVRIYADMYV